MAQKPSQKPWYMEALEKRDPEFAQMLGSLMAKVNSPGALDAKTKTLITLALDAAGYHRDGVVALAKRARAQGASDAEIWETIRLAYVVGGFPGLTTGLAAFEG
ncbi:MAG: carboxymuconolactone decarboxylase family protein [Chloroflexi bacterium]|nr:carboxymuconolactone decarboxylase family protein [Chloroflexota bacterium]